MTTFKEKGRAKFYLISEIKDDKGTVFSTTEGIYIMIPNPDPVKSK